MILCPPWKKAATESEYPDHWLEGSPVQIMGIISNIIFGSCSHSIGIPSAFRLYFSPSSTCILYSEIFFVHILDTFPLSFPAIYSQLRPH